MMVVDWWLVEMRWLVEMVVDDKMVDR